MRQPHHSLPSPDVPAIPAIPAAIAPPRAEPSLLDDPATHPALAGVLQDMHRRWPELARDADHPLADHLAKCGPRNNRRNSIAWIISATILVSFIAYLSVLELYPWAFLLLWLCAWLRVNNPPTQDLEAEAFALHRSLERGERSVHRLFPLKAQQMCGICICLAILDSRALRCQTSVRIVNFIGGAAGVIALLAHAWLLNHDYSSKMVTMTAQCGMYLLIPLIIACFSSESTIARGALSRFMGSLIDPRWHSIYILVVVGFASSSSVAYETSFFAGVSCLAAALFVTFVGAWLQSDRQAEIDHFGGRYSEAMHRVAEYPAYDETKNA